jgi:nitrogenase molybdenum-iron protein NifN
MTATVTTARASAGLIDPLKHSGPTGAALAFNGLRGCLPVMHGPKGCASFAKVLFTLHFREPIPLQGTGVDQVTAVLGAGDLLTTTLDALVARHDPELIGLCTTGLTETNGEDVAGELRGWREAQGDRVPPVVLVSTPDLAGGLSDGYGAAVASLVGELAVPGPVVPGTVALLPGPTVGPLDTEEIAELVTAFGLSPVAVPNLAGTLDGHLSDGWSILPAGGTTLADIAATGSAEIAVGVGEAVRPAIDALDAIGTPTRLLPCVTGLEATDALVAELVARSDLPVPDRVRRWRRRLADGLIDAHFVLGDTRVALALEPDLLVAVAGLLTEVGAEVVTAVAPQRSPVLARASCDEVVIGGFAEVEERAAEAGAEILVASSHGRRAAATLGLTHVRLGFPITDRLGAGQQQTVGYRGSLALVTRLANAVLRRDTDRHHPGPVAGGSSPPPATDHDPGEVRPC